MIMHINNLEPRDRVKPFLKFLPVHRPQLKTMSNNFINLESKSCFCWEWLKGFNCKWRGCILAWNVERILSLGSLVLCLVFFSLLIARLLNHHGGETALFKQLFCSKNQSITTNSLGDRANCAIGEITQRKFPVLYLLPDFPQASEIRLAASCHKAEII